MTTKHLRLDWHPSRDLLGVSSHNPESGGFISFFTKKGGKPFFTSKVRPLSSATCFCWHPSESLLAVGWENGHLSLVDPNKKTESQDLDVGLAQICCLLWDGTGTLLIAADIKGEIQTFEFDTAESRLDHLNNAQLKEERPRDVCCKKIAKKSLHPSSAGSGGAKFGSAGKDRGQSLALEQRKEGDGTLGELLSRHKPRQQWESNLEGVEGEERASTKMPVETVPVFLLGTEQGGIFLLEPRSNQLNRIFQADSGIRQLVDMPGRVYCLAITEGMMFYQLAIEGRLANDKIKVKLSAQSKHFQMLRVDAHTVAFGYGEREIRIWDLEAGDSAILRLSSDRGYEGSDEQVLMLSYSLKKDSICGVTSKWRLATWRRVREDSADGGHTPIDQQWKLASAISLNIPKVIGMAWSKTSTAFALNSGDSVQIFLSQCVEFYVDSEFAVIQVSAQLLTLVKITDPVETQELQLHSNIRGFYVNGGHLLLWDDAKIQLDQIQCPKDAPIKISHVAAFDVPNVLQAAYYNQHVYTLANEQLLVHTLQGTVKRAITFREIEGHPEQISVKAKWLCVASSLGYLRIYDLSEGSMKLTFRSSNLRNSIPQFGRWLSIRVNSAGNRISFTVQNVDEERPCERLFVWEAENDSVGYFSFHSGITDQQQYEQDSVASAPGTGTGSAEQRPKTAAIRKIESEQSRYRLPLHLPGNHFWDQNDPRLLVCEAISASGGTIDGPIASHLLTMFVTAEHGIQMHDLQPKSAKADSLVFVSVPFIFFLRNIEVDDEDDLNVERSISRLIFRRNLREFVGIDPGDTKAVQAMLDFSFFLCIGQMDNAFKAIKFIKSESVWEHMARMCVKTRRIDVARVCLGHMGNARSARAIRQSVEQKEELDMQIAKLAIELGMMEEAIRLYEKSGRWDELNRIYQAQGKWAEAFEVAEKNDRIHLRHTHFVYAKHLESIGAIEKAIEHYEKANVHHFEVPRMLCDEPKVLEFYIKKRSEPELFKWWAQFLESTGDLETAKNYYQNAGDFLSVVRILCQNGQLEEAVNIVKQTGNRAAGFHLALQFETAGDFDQAVHYFSDVGAYSSALRLAKEHNMVDRMANLALMAGGTELVEAADFYRDLPGHADKAVMLYHKAGMIGRALDYAFRTGQFGALDLIAQELNEKSEPSVLIRAAEFFSANQQDRTAVQLLVYAKKYSQAVQLCQEKNVIITEELDSMLTPDKLENLSPVERSRLLDQIAKCCLQQGNYHFAAKKFTQAGNKLEAMRALLKSGDTKRVILFANTARDKDIFRMAGNHLQTLSSWKEDAQLMRQIETFYVKAGAMDLLSNFYEACAQVEIDEFHDYEKAAAAYSEALRCLNKKLEKDQTAKGMAQTQQQQRYLAERQEQLREQLELIRRFLDIKMLYETDPGESMRQLGEFSERPGINDSVRLGDIYAILIGHNVKRDNTRKAWQLIEHCEQRARPRIDIRQFLSRQMLNQICDQMGVPRLKSSEKPEHGEEKEGEEEGTVEFSHALRRRIRADVDDSNGNGIE